MTIYLALAKDIILVTSLEEQQKAVIICHGFLLHYQEVWVEDFILVSSRSHAARHALRGNEMMR
jgi:hypothetical protein